MGQLFMVLFIYHACDDTEWLLYTENYCFYFTWYSSI